MIYLRQNDRQYDYDVRAITLAFFAGEKIKEVPFEEAVELSGNEIAMTLHYRDQQVDGEIRDSSGKALCEAVYCDYSDHEHCRNDMCRFLYRLLSGYTGRKLPWGILTGIRPTKIMFHWMDETPGISRTELEKRFQETYLANAQKAGLCAEVADHERRLLARKDYADEYSLYVGIPFCPTTCLYCSFTSFPLTGFSDRIPAYMEALRRELSYVAGVCKGRRLSTVYVGGGTPTALPEPELKMLMEMLHELFPVSDAEEFCVEAGRPDSVNPEKLAVLKDAGVSRISINPQTMHDETLRLIGRAHTVAQTRQAFEMARSAGFHNINMDMITGLPGEDITQIEKTLEDIFALRPESLTVHSLAIKRASNLNIQMENYRKMIKGSTDEMLRLVDSYAHDMGMQAYYMYRQKNIPGNLENIGYSIPGRECLYNILIMEEKQDIISCGAGGSTKYVFPEENRIERTENVKNLDHYIKRIDEMIDRKRKYHGG